VHLVGFHYTNDLIVTHFTRDIVMAVNANEPLTI